MIKYASPLMLLIVLLLAACKEQQQSSHWDGHWSRTLTVPEGLKGRCVDEALDIKDKRWYLKIVVHLSKPCNQPYLELGFEGVVKEVKIRRHSEDKDVRLQVHGIRLASMVDIAGEIRSSVPADSLPALSPKFVPADQAFFEQRLLFNADNTSMKANVYPPVLARSMPDYPANLPFASYQRQ